MITKVQLNTLHKKHFHYLVYITFIGIKKSCFLTNIVFFNLKEACKYGILITDKEDGGRIVMKILLSMKYLTFPVNVHTTSKKVCIKENGKLIFDFDCKVDMIAPHFTAYIDVSRFTGKTVDISISPDMKFEVGMADEMNLPDFGFEALRPQIHFTVANGWNNDPNGLILYEGKYHMFYQYNPASTEWGNMHWGHAVSSDLLHWEHRDITLFPDEMGTMYSGSAIEDVHNVTGLKCNEHNPLLLYYTVAPDRNILSQGKHRCQCLAYSTDGGYTFEKYSKNPVVDVISEPNRDPKVVYVSELEKYLMIFYLDDDRYYMMTSHNLLDWEEYCEISILGDWECPDIFKLKCEGKWYWVIMGAYDNYLVGNFTKNGFVPLGEEKRLSFCKLSYAAQSFSGLPEGEAVKIAWIKTRVQGMPFSEQMGFPMQMHLEKIQDRYYLAGQPHDNISLLRKKTYKLSDTAISGKTRFNVGPNPIEIILNMPYIENTKLTLRLFGSNLTVDVNLNQISFCGVKMPLSVLQNSVNIRIVVDRCSVECYADGGIFCFATKCLSDYNLPYVELYSENATQIENFECYILDSIYNKKDEED